MADYVGLEDASGHILLEDGVSGLLRESVMVVSIVGRFQAAQMRVGQLGIPVPVPGVYPPGFISSVTGLVTSGDGHVSLGVPSGQFGTVTATIGGAAQTKPVGGVPSAQAFGTITRITGGISSSSSGVPSAQAFGAVTPKATVRTTVPGVPSAQSFGVPKVSYVEHLGGVPSAQAFGTVTTRSGFTKQVGGVPSAQAFGIPKAVWNQTLQLGGIPSAQAFGALTIKGSVKPKPGGVPSAQAFGAIHVVSPQTVHVPGVGSAQAFGTLTAYVAWLHDLVCIGSPDQAICGVPICGDGDVCGGYGFLADLDCISSSDPAVLNEFLVGQKPVGGWANFTEDLDCIDSPTAAICDNPTICGTPELVCGGLSFTRELDCVYSPDPTILNEFLLGQRLVTGPLYITSTPDPIVLDLQPVECG